MIDKPQIVQTTAQPAAVIHITTPRSEIQNVMGPAYSELMEAVTAQGIAPTGPWFTHHLKFSPEMFDFEIGVPIDSQVSPVGRVKAGELPARTVARTIYRGDYEGLSSAWEEFDAWIKSEGRIPEQDVWEIYTAGPETNPDPMTWRTELNRPLVR